LSEPQREPEPDELNCNRCDADRVERLGIGRE
jgi:hypothetical protein